MAYIDRDDLVRNLNKFASEHYSALINMLIMKQPIADVEEVKRGEWIYTQTLDTLGGTDATYDWTCSVCKGTSVDDTNFCPNCGADMRGGKEK